MNINSLYGSIASPSLTNVGSVGAIGTSPASGAQPALSGSASATISKPGQFFSAMQQLSQQNPAQFKAVAAKVAASFQSAANQASGPQAQFLTNLANQFNQAAQSGTLAPSQGPQSPRAPQGVQGAGQSGSGAGTHHHHHHGGGGGAVSQSSSIEQAFQSAISILDQSTGGAPTGTS